VKLAEFGIGKDESKVVVYCYLRIVITNRRLKYIPYNQRNTSEPERSECKPTSLGFGRSRRASKSRVSSMREEKQIIKGDYFKQDEAQSWTKH
jgi:hypothetical protein